MPANPPRQALYTTAPLAELTQITYDTDPLINRGASYRKVQFYKDRESAVLAAQTPRPKINLQPAHPVYPLTSINPEDLLHLPPAL